MSKGNGYDNRYTGNWNGNQKGNWNGNNHWQGKGNWNGKGDWNNNGHWNNKGNWHGNTNWNRGWGWGGSRIFVYAPLWSTFGGGYFYGNNYGYSYPYDTYAYDVPLTYQAQYAEPVEQPLEQPAEPLVDQAAAPSAEFGEQAMQAFASGDYQGAARFAQHAVVDNAQGAKPRELLSLALFAMGEYRGAAIEAHYALSYGPPADWPTLHRYYGDAARYSKQLDALAAYVREHRDSPEAQFLLAYHNLMLGHKQRAAEGFARVLALTPKDDIAQKMVTQLGGTPPATATPPPPQGEKPLDNPAAPNSAQKPVTEPSDIPPPLPRAEATR